MISLIIYISNWGKISHPAKNLSQQISVSFVEALEKQISIF